MLLSWLRLSRTARAGATSVVGLLCVTGLATAPVATADTCPNAALRVENNSTELPECRAYEMVTPPYKQGFSITPKAFTDDGVVSYFSAGNFAGNAFGQLNNQYLATRSATGWDNQSLNPPADRYVSLLNIGADAQSPDLRWSLFPMYPRDHPSPTGFLDYYLRAPDGAFTLVGKAWGPFTTNMRTVGTSADLSRVVFQHGSGSGVAAETALYEFVGTGHEDPPLPVSVDNPGVATAGETCPNSTSVDGRVIVFTSGCHGTGQLQVWARVGASATVAVSGSECTRTAPDAGGACNSSSDAQYVGAAVDGSRVFFTTEQQLVNGDTDQSRDLYMCDIPSGAPAPAGTANHCAGLTQLSGAAPDARVESVPVVSEDGTRAYFVAHGALADNLGVNDAAPVASDTNNNLYLWSSDAAHPAGEIKFVAPLDADDLSRVQMTPDGRYVTLITATALVNSGPGRDDDAARDLYRYDATTGAIDRLSTSVAGDGGNGSGFDVETGNISSMTLDGSLVVFETAEALSPRDTDGVTDVYAWRDGRVSLISKGDGHVLWVTPSGRDIFFTTGQPLVAGDGDVNGDLYSARVGGGFHPAPQGSCSGDGCQGPLSDTPTLAGAESRLPAQSASVEPVPVVSLRTVSATQRRRFAATGKATVTVVANVAGAVTVTGTATIAGRTATVVSGRRTMTKGGSLAVPLTLSRRARVQLAARGKLTVRVTVTHSKVAIGRSATLKLTRPRVKKSSVGGRA